LAGGQQEPRGFPLVALAKKQSFFDEAIIDKGVWGMPQLRTQFLRQEVKGEASIYKYAK